MIYICGGLLVAAIFLYVMWACCACGGMADERAGRDR